MPTPETFCMGVAPTGIRLQAQIPLRRLPRNFPVRGSFGGSRRNGIWAKGDVTGLSRTSRGGRHSGIWALSAICYVIIHRLLRARPTLLGSST